MGRPRCSSLVSMSVSSPWRQHNQEKGARFQCLSIIGKLVMDRQSVGNVMPCRLRAREDMSGWSNGWCIDERAHRHMHIASRAHHRIEKRATGSAMDIMLRLRVAVGEN